MVSRVDATNGARRPSVRAAFTLVAAALVAATWFRKPVEGVQEAAVDTAFLGLKSFDVAHAVEAGLPGAMPGNYVAHRIIKAIRPFEVKKDNVVFGHSIPSDEINSDRGHLATVLGQYYGNSYVLGGMGGAPFAGKSGFWSFSSHVPTGGHVVLVFGSQLGYSPSAEPGKFLRNGQGVSSAACGAAVTAYSQITSGQKIPFDARDLEQHWLRERLRPHCAEIEKSAKPMIELAKKTYKIVEEEVMKIVNTNWGAGNLVLIGGITINMPYPMTGYFQPLHFSIRSSSRPPFNLMPAFS